MLQFILHSFRPKQCIPCPLFPLTQDAQMHLPRPQQLPLPPLWLAIPSPAACPYAFSAKREKQLDNAYIVASFSYVESLKQFKV